ncbi:heavy metal sensor kinase family protein [Collimonas arenae]|uniref:Sensor protein n=1 Tax=Collimonas arenae TaxID=279058 RepID=A0A127QMV2_9BURK|nr:heavy metal sensor histidine kinase [Collimonas arenae]AMP01037.1 heavy metal sensor kinase family protein [Collimonas arenae]AMP10932.1 heavy metal sensor kinase family protein [Collimonas arenae]
MKRSITVRLVAMFALAALLIFSLIGSALYGVLRRELARHQQDELNTRFQDTQYMIGHNGDPSRWPRVQAKLDTLSPADGSIRYWVLGDDPRFQYGKGLAEIDQLDRNPNGMSTMQLRGREYPLHAMTGTIPPFMDRPAVRLIVAVDAAPYMHTMHAFLLALVGLSLVGVLLVMLLGYWIAQVGLRPLKQLSSEAQALGPRNLSQRLKISPLPDELSDLTIAFNGALERMEGAYNQLEAFNADVAHELRTPLANLIGETQVALSRQRTAPHFEEVLQSNLEELERLRSIINDMLFLARADQGEAATSLVHASIAQEINKTVEFFEFVLDESKMTVNVDGDIGAEASIETSLFRRAMSNLLHNAIQHSKPGAGIVVRITQQPAAIQIAVSNPGQPIAGTHLPRLFDRFYRVDAARNDRDPSQLHGHGLGLAIVKAIAKMHGGSVFANSVAGLTTIGFSIPAGDDTLQQIN